jgi:hypothetical protein
MSSRFPCSLGIARSAGFAFVIVIASVTVSCFPERNVVLQKDSRASILFVGAPSGAAFELEQNGEIVYPSTEIRPSAIYELRPGTYLVRVLRDGAPIVERRLFLADGQTTEVAVP